MNLICPRCHQFMGVRQQSVDARKTGKDMLEIAEKCAVDRYDGHLMLLRFTTGWKAYFGTVDLYHGEGAAQVSALPTFPTAEEALHNAIVTDPALSFLKTSLGL